MPNTVPQGDRWPGLLPTDVRLAAAALGLRTDSLRPMSGGATRRTWASGKLVLRTGDALTLRRELLAMSAAARALPVPRVLEAVEFSDDAGRPSAALLLSRLPGRPAGKCAGLPLREARRRGEACGRLHAVLGAVAAPRGLVAVNRVPAALRSTECGLLHLDLHPLNVLIDDAGEVTGVVDWANTAAGPAVLDHARTWSILALDPAAVRLREEPCFAAFAEGWSRAAAFEHLPSSARAWACQKMLDDLATRYPGHRLDHVRQCLAEIEGSM